MKINKLKLNFTIDILMFIAMIPIAGIGFLIKYVLVPGFKRNEVFGSDVELYFWGIDRHQWGTIHLTISFVLLFLLLLHIVFHWKQIGNIFKSMVAIRKWRIILGSLLVVFILLFGVVPLFIQPEIVKAEPHHYRQHESSLEGKHRNQKTNTLAIDAKVIEQDVNTHKSEEHSDVEVNGKMTMNEVARKYSIPISKLSVAAGIPIERANEKLGRLKKIYGFDMNDFRKIIEEMASN